MDCRSPWGLAKAELAWQPKFIARLGAMMPIDFFV
jgi:hypothetical protein